MAYLCCRWQHCSSVGDSVLSSDSDGTCSAGTERRVGRGVKGRARGVISGVWDVMGQLSKRLKLNNISLS